MSNILVVDSSGEREKIADIYRNNGYSVMTCENAFDAISKLKAYDFDLIISEVELPGDNAFDLYNYMHETYPYIPVIMMTSRDMDLFFENIFREGIGNVLQKPIREQELTALSVKLITRRNIFGIDNYLRDTRDIKRIRIQSSRQVPQAIDAIIKQIGLWNFPLSNRMPLSLILNELAINAVYHSHGLTQEKIERRPVRLAEDEYVDIFFARNDGGYGISINDYRGRLTRNKILESINSVIIQENIILHAAETGEDVSSLVSETGRGIDLVRKLAGEYYFIIRKDQRTEIVILFNDHNAPGQKDGKASLKIIEDF